MKRIFALFISISSILFASGQEAEDSTRFNKSLSFGIELTGPVISSVNKSSANYEAYAAYRINHKYYLVAEAGYGSFNYEQYNYIYNCSGPYVRIGTDINLLKPEVNPGNHFAGIGLRYGMSVIRQETPWLSYGNYWGTYESSLDPSTFTGPYLQLSGVVKAELFRNIFLGWTIRMNLMIYQSAGPGNRPVIIPGMGSTDGGIQPGVSFHLGWIIPV